MQLTSTPRSSHKTLLQNLFSSVLCSILASFIVLVFASNSANGQGKREPNYPVGKKFPVKYKFGEPTDIPKLKRPTQGSGQNMEVDSGYDPEGDRRRKAELRKQQQQAGDNIGNGLMVSKSRKQAPPAYASNESTRRPQAVADGHYEVVNRRRKPIRPPSGSSKYKG